MNIRFILAIITYFIVSIIASITAHVLLPLNLASSMLLNILILMIAWFVCYLPLRPPHVLPEPLQSPDNQRLLVVKIRRFTLAFALYLVMQFAVGSLFVALYNSGYSCPTLDNVNSASNSPASCGISSAIDLIFGLAGRRSIDIIFTWLIQLVLVGAILKLTNPNLKIGLKLPSQPSGKKSLNWRSYFTFLTLANIILIVFPVLYLLWIAYSYTHGSHKGESGSEFIAMLLYPLMTLGLIVALLNITTIPVFLLRHKPRLRTIILDSIVIVLSVGFLTVFGYEELQIINQGLSEQEFHRGLSSGEAISLINTCQVDELDRNTSGVILITPKKTATNKVIIGIHGYRTIEKTDFGVLKTAVMAAALGCDGIGIRDDITGNNIARSIPVGRGIDLLNSCKLERFYYEDPNYASISKAELERSPTGIVLEASSYPSGIDVAGRLQSQMLPIARHAHDTCPNGLEIFFDGMPEKGWSKAR